MTPLAQFGLDPKKQATLFRLRALLTWRQFMREPGQIMGVIGFLLFFVPVSLGLGVGSAAGFLFLDDPWPGEILGAILTLVWLIWIFAPLLSYRLNEGLDLTRLLIYPLRGRDLMATGIAGTIFDLPSYLTLPIVIAVFVGWTTWATLPIILLALIIWYAQLMISSQMVLHASGGLLRSRRFRDLSIVIFSLFGMSCYFISQFFNYLSQEITAESLQNVSLLVYLQWTPPGAAAKAIERSAAGDWPFALLWLIYAGAWVYPLAWGWRRVTSRLLTGAGLWDRAAKPDRPTPSAPRPSSPRATPTAAPLSAQPLWNWIPFPIRQLAGKELSQTWRVPQRRISMLQGLIMPVMFAVIWGVNPWSGEETTLDSPWFIFMLPAYSLLSVWATSQNMLGWEGPGLQTLLLTPIRRRTLFAGKALGLLIQVAGINAILALILGWVLQTWWAIPAWVVGIGVSLAGLAVTMPASVRFAHPVNLESTSRNATATGGGCLTGLINGLFIPITIGIVNAPLAALFGYLFWQNLQWVIWPAGFISLGYGLVLFGLGLDWAEKLLLNYEPEVLEATSKPGTSGS